MISDLATTLDGLLRGIRAERVPALAGAPTTPPFPGQWGEEHLRWSVATPAGARGPRVRVDLAEPWASCAACQGHRHVFRRGVDGYEYATPCRCAGLVRVADCVNRASMPSALLRASLSEWAPNGRRPDVSRIRAYIDGWTPGTRGRVLCGPNGVGKTWLAGSIARGLALRGVYVIWASWTELLDSIKDGYADGTSEVVVTRPLMDAAVLVVDDIGAEQSTEWSQTAFFRLLGRRLEDGGTTIITANAATPEALGRLVGDRVYSRLTGACDVVSIGAGGRDLRGRLAASPSERP